jgi:Gpi18-like mannosyltransferase
MKISTKERLWTFPLLNYDGKRYLSIAQGGYPTFDQMGNRAFFPVYPFTVRYFSNITHLDIVISGILLSIIFAIIGIIFLYKYLKLEYGEKVAYRASILTLFFPTAFYFYLYYTESLFLTLSVIIFYLIKKEKYYWASIFTAIICATRITGIFFVLYLVVVAVRNRIGPKLQRDCHASSNEARNDRLPFYLLIAPLGFVLYNFYLYIYFDDFLGMIRTQTYWKKSFSFFGTITAGYIWLSQIVQGYIKLKIDIHAYVVMIFEFLSYIFYILFLIFSFKKIKWEYWFYAFFCFLLPTAASSLTSINRYMLLVFPISIFLAQRLSKKWYYVVLFIFAIIYLYFETLFLRNYWVA